MASGASAIEMTFMWSDSDNWLLMFTLIKMSEPLT